MRVRILTLNVWNTEGDPRRPQIINRGIRQLEPDLIRYLSGKQSLDGRSVRYHDAWAIVDNGPGYTWCSGNPNARTGAEQIVGQPGYRCRFDCVFVGSWDAHPKTHARVLAARLAFDEPVDGIWASDHFGVLVDLEVGTDGKTS